MALRESVRWRLTDTTGGPDTAPYIIYAREDRMAQNAPGYDPDAFVLHTQGHMRAISPRLEVLAECLRQEWAQPGFVTSILNPRQDCHVASLDPASAEALRSRQAFDAKAAREFAREEEARKAALARRTPKPPPVDPRSLSAEDIFDD
jgi:hypothetical protein